LGFDPFSTTFNNPIMLPHYMLIVWSD